MERFLDLSDRDEVLRRVLHDWLLRELRDDIVSKITWKHPELDEACGRLRVRADLDEPHDIYFLTPVGLDGQFFYKNPVGEALYSAECDVVVDHEDAAIRTRLARGRLYWVGGDGPRGYRISEGFEQLLQDVQAQLLEQTRTSS